MEDPIRQEDRRSRRDLFKGFARSRTPSPTKTRAAEAVHQARPVQLPASLVMPGGSFMLPPDHPDAKIVLKHIDNNAERGSPTRADSNESKRRRPETYGRPLSTPCSPPKRRFLHESKGGKENVGQMTASGKTRPGSIWNQFTSHASLLEQGSVQSPTQTPALDSTPSSSAALVQIPPSTQISKSQASLHNFVGTSQSRSTVGSVTSASSGGQARTGYVLSKFSLVGNREEALRSLEKEDFDQAFEAVLSARNVPEQTRRHLRAMDVKVKREFIKNGSSENVAEEQPEQAKSSFWKLGKPKSGRGRSATRNGQEEDEKESRSPSKRDMSRGRTAENKKADRSPSKKPRSLSRPRSLMSLKNLSTSSLHTLGFDGAQKPKEQQVGATTGDPRTPDDFVDYLQEVQDPLKVEVGKLHKLRILLRNESIIWIDNFVQQGGVRELLALLDRVLKIEWREEHEDLVLHEVLLCLKGLSTSQPGLEKILEVESTLFPTLLKVLFNQDKKGPSEFSDRKAIIDLLYAQLTSAAPSELVARAKSILSYISDPGAEEHATPLDFIKKMHQTRPYTHWCREILNVSREVFWIFMHHSNVISAASIAEDGRPYSKRHFPPPSAPVPAAPHVGGVEYDATRYIAGHLELMNGLIASLPTREARNILRNDLKSSGFEKLMGGKLRICREKYYGVIHEGLRTWLAAAAEDGWPTADVSRGPVLVHSSGDCLQHATGAPKLELPKLDLGVGDPNETKDDEGWL